MRRKQVNETITTIQVIEFKMNQFSLNTFAHLTFIVTMITEHIYCGLFFLFFFTQNGIDYFVIYVDLSLTQTHTYFDKHIMLNVERLLSSQQRVC